VFVPQTVSLTAIRPRRRVFAENAPSPNQSPSDFGIGRADWTRGRLRRACIYL